METTRTTLVVGGTSGIGLAAARRLAAGGDTVHVASRDPGKVAKVADAAPELVAHRVNGSDSAAVAELAGSLAPVDALVVTIASSAGMGPLVDLELAELRRGFEEKVIAMLTVLQAALPHLAERASITLVGAISAHAAMPGTAGIGAVNAAVESIVRPLAVELAPRRINAVSPGLVDTPWWDGMPEQARTDYFAAAEKGLPVRHVSSADEIGEAVALLATNTSITGTILEVDGGARFVQL
ncbi:MULTISPECIES: SDR family oxidoreductase [Frankia]|uniref:Oxidoreductase n=1 Tax=Frankia alni (strain DSM 45986 / CECT 9034 / ACN14a) TaxID=326424 RepID=Q0RKJ2_FRAAA|nr:MULTISPECIES: SDR family oxidoreductase [Frankia]CAJ61966.1 putative oxidoreductase [Frankia alni ACN14a]